MTKDLRLKIYPAVIAILGLSLLALLLSRIEIQIDRNPDLSTDSITPVEEIPPAPVPVKRSPTPITELPIPSSPSPTVASDAVPTKPTSVQGGLRVSNQTPFPIRIALLPHRTDKAQVAEATSDTYSQPVHWDFAPEEGEAKGLILSLPNQNLRLQPGDVLVGFAQDGSRRYWGPYVVGRTALPTWSAGQKEWVLVLQP